MMLVALLPEGFGLDEGSTGLSFIACWEKRKLSNCVQLYSPSFFHILNYVVNYFV